MRYDKIEDEDKNLLCNILYRSLMKQTIPELETGLMDQTWGELDMLQLQVECIDFGDMLREEVKEDYYYYIALGSRKFGILYDRSNELYTVYQVFPTQLIQSNPILEISKRTLDGLKHHNFLATRG